MSWKQTLLMTTMISFAPFVFADDSLEEKNHHNHIKRHHKKQRHHQGHHHGRHTGMIGSKHVNVNQANMYTRLANLEQSKKTHHSEHTHLSHVHSSKKEANKPNKEHKGHIKKGQFKVPGTDTHLRIYGYVKLDAIYDAGAPSGDSSVIPALALRNFELNANRTGQMRLHARQSRFGFETNTPSQHGHIKTVIEGDFFGTNNFVATTGPASSGAATPQINRSTSTQTGAYNFRLRHAYAEVGPWLFGQYFSVFSDYSTLGETVEFNGPTGSNLIRQPQIRYTKKVDDHLTIAAGLEAGNSDYYDQSGLQKGEVVDGIGDGYSGLPDLTFSAKYAGYKDQWSFSVRGMARQIRVRIVSNTPAENGGAFHKKKMGYGLGASFKLFTHGKNNLFSQVNFGDGIGRYIFDLSGMGASINTSLQRMETVFGLGWLIGYQHFWTEKLRSSFIWSTSGVKQTDLHTPVNTQNNTLSSNTINRRLKAGFMNIIYSPRPNIDLGAEFAYFRRETIAGLKGVAKRFQFCGTYRF